MTVHIREHEWRDALELALAATAADGKVQPVLDSVAVFPNDAESVTVVGTDGHRMITLAVRAQHDDLSADEPLVYSRKDLLAVKTWFSKSVTPSTARLEHGMITTEGHELDITMVAGNYPSYQHLLNSLIDSRQGATRISADAGLWAYLLKPHGTEAVKLYWSESGVIFSSRSDIETVTHSDGVSASLGADPDDRTVAVNGRYLASFIKAIIATHGRQAPVELVVPMLGKHRKERGPLEVYCGRISGIMQLMPIYVQNSEVTQVMPALRAEQVACEARAEERSD